MRVALLYLLFFLSGATALVYEIVWVRALTLVFGGSHLAVTSVLAVFMGGLALGSWRLGRWVDRSRRPLRLYGLLEIGIGLTAAIAALLVEFYPALYVPLARLDETSPLWLTFVRVAFSFAALIVPTTLMGGTLPVLSRFVTDSGGRLGSRLAALYGLNTLGAVAGSLAAGFLLLPRLGANTTTAFAIATSLAIGGAALLLPEQARGTVPAAEPARSATAAGAGTTAFPLRLVLWAIGLSGFCALGYEVLWTRVLSMVVGTSVYSFTIMLVAFLTGIALGGHAEALLPRSIASSGPNWRRAVVTFGIVQVAIGLLAAATTYALRGLPLYATTLKRWLAADGSEFSARQVTSFLLAFGLMAVPAFFMGLAFPLAGTIHAGDRRAVGRAVGEVLAANTVGAILGAAGSGFALIYLFGIERSLQLLVIVNVGLGLAVVASTLGRRGRLPATGVALATAMTLVALVVNPEVGRVWDRKFFAVFRNNQRGVFDDTEKVRDALANTDVLYYHEGANETISVIRPKGSAQALLVNGRVEASTHAQDVQCQRTLGHLPMLVHPDPRRVFVLGLGTGMTLGATSIHPEVERITLAEIEPGVFPAARTFGAYNHEVLDSPKLRVVSNDGRNFLRTTRETFDVITADPIHPWSGGAAYLYTTEYFRLAADRLDAGGLICQWLPIYELSVEDVRSVVRTFGESFRHIALWLTHYDAELLGSNDPLVFDEARLATRFANPAVASDLAAVDMGSPRDFLSYFLAGDASLRAFARDGVLNTDDNLWLEFSAPRSQGVEVAPAVLVAALAAHREPLVDYLDPGTDAGVAAERRAFWSAVADVAPRYDRAHALALANRFDAEFAGLVEGLRRERPDFAPLRFLERYSRLMQGQEPRRIAAERFEVLDPGGATSVLEISAVVMRVGEERGAVVFVDNERRAIYGQRYIDAAGDRLEQRFEELSTAVLAALRSDYEAESRAALERGGRLPERAALTARLEARVAQLTSTPP